MEEGQYELVIPKISPLEYYTKLSLLKVFVSGMRIVQPFRTEKFHVDGLEHLATTGVDGKPQFRMPGPYLFLGQHVAWDDFVNLPPICEMFPESILFTGPSRNDYIKELLPNHSALSAVGDSVVSALFGLLFFPVYRTWTVKDPSAEELRKMQEHNKATLDEVLRAYQKGINIAIMPEGTSKTDGRIAKIRSGAYTYATGTPIHPYCIPFGNTYDYFAGKKPHVFVRFGVPYKHQAVEAEQGESPEEYRKRDMVVFNARIRDEFIDLNTITATQLTAAVLYGSMGKYEINRFGLAFVVHNLIDKFRDANFYVDPSLSDFEGVEQRLDTIMDALQAEGYITLEKNRSITINRERALHVPERVERYKKENVLLYTFHRISEVAEARPQVEAILRERVGFLPKY